MDEDMPQPLTSVKTDARISINPDALANYPALAAKVMHTIGIWAHCDGDTATILSSLLNGDIVVGTAMYQALSGGEARKAALYAAAQAALPPDEFILLQAVIRVTKASRDRRNDFAHNAWGSSEDIPDALLLMHPSVVVNRQARFRQEVEDTKTPIEIIDGKVRHVLRWPDVEFDRSQIFVYRAEELDRIVADAQQANELLGLLYHSIGYGRTAQARQQLLSRPQIQQAIEVLTRESAPEVREKLRPVEGA